MDFYEELGVERRASSAEIRQAYRRLVRLHHPDFCQEDAERRLAEIQLKRLNGIVAVLSDAAERKKYDRSLDLSPGELAPRSVVRRKSPAIWVILMALLCGGIVFVSSRLPRPPAPAIALNPEPGPAVAPPDPPKTADAIRPTRRAATRGPDPPPEPASAQPRPVTAYIPQEPPRYNEPALPALPTIEIAPTPVSPAPYRAEPTVAGDWLFIPASRHARGATYTPEFIEMHVDEAAGRVRGRYRARYRVADRAISPTVVFEFEGSAAPEKLEAPWAGPGGANGMVKLRLLTANSLEVSWVADRLGKELALISGTATLVRKQE